MRSKLRDTFELNGRYKSRINDGSDYYSLDALVRRCQNLESNFELFESEKAAENPSAGNNNGNNRRGRGTANGGSCKSSNPSKTPAEGDDKDYLDVTVKLNDVMRERLDKEELCRRCRDNKPRVHKSYEEICPRHPKNKANKPTVAAISEPHTCCDDKHSGSENAWGKPHSERRRQHGLGFTVYRMGKAAERRSRGYSTGVRRYTATARAPALSSLCP